MNHIDMWKPSKFVFKNGKLIGSRDPNQVGIASRLITDIVAEKYQENICSHVQGKLLDLGCGMVPLFEAYKGYIKSNICVDWVSSLHKNEYLDLEHDLTKTLPFNDAVFDTIILSDVLEHIPEPDKLFSEMARVLAVDGKLIMNVPFYYQLHEKPNDFYRYTEFALKRFAKNSNLTLLKLEIIGGVPEILTDILAKNLLKVPIFGKWFSLLLQWLAFLFLKTHIGKSTSNRTKKNFPFGYFLVVQKN